MKNTRQRLPTNSKVGPTTYGRIGYMMMDGKKAVETAQGSFKTWRRWLAMWLSLKRGPHRQ